MFIFVPSLLCHLLAIASSAQAPALNSIHAAVRDDECRDSNETGGSCSAELLQTSKKAARSHPPLRTIVINLASRHDRWEAMQEQLRAFQTRGLLRVERLNATVGNAVSIPNEVIASKKLLREDLEELFGNYSKFAGVNMLPEMKLGMAMYSNSPKTGSDWPVGQAGCAMSHVRAWQEVAVGSQPALILEDDATLHEDLVGTIQDSLQALALRSDDLDMLYLEYNTFECWIMRWDAECPTTFAALPLLNASRSYSFGEAVKTLGSGRELIKAKFLLNNAAYVLTPAGARKLLNSLPLRYQNDLTMGIMMHKKALQAFLVFPPPAYQQ